MSISNIVHHTTGTKNIILPVATINLCSSIKTSEYDIYKPRTNAIPQRRASKSNKLEH